VRRTREPEKICVVLTTVHSGDLLEGYCAEAENEGCTQKLRFVVIPDCTTPPCLYQKCAHLLDNGFDIQCPTLEEQESFLRKIGPISKMIPYNSDNRRNIGFLLALAWGCTFLISLDDDNFCIAGSDFFGEHAIVCEDNVSAQAVRSSDGWFNVCDLLQLHPENTAPQIYPRGFPYHKRNVDREIRKIAETGTVRLNAGLWLQEPDLDAMTWLVAPAGSTAFRGSSVLLGSDVWSPINTQNTALHRDLIVAYYFIRMGYSLAGLTIDRYGDIFSGYFVQACVRHMGHRIRVGTPVADHRRNSHDYMRDLAGELGCIQILEDLMRWLPGVKLQGSTYEETYLSLADAIDGQIDRFRGSIWCDGTRAYFREMTHCMRQWIAACNILK
jgi:Reversibly glycosylated polypeptide